MRTALEVFEDHLSRRLHSDVEGDIAANYAESVILLTGDGVFMGHEGVRRCAALLDERIPRARLQYRTRLVNSEVAFLEWSASSMFARIVDGADSFVIRDGRIAVQTIHYTAAPKA